MKYAVPVVLSLVVLITSPAKATQLGSEPVYQKHSSSKIQTQTKNVLVRAVPKNKRQLLAFNPTDIDDTDGPLDAEIHDAHVSYRRPEVVHSTVDPVEDELSDYVKVRLAVARARAVDAYRQKYCNLV